MLEPHQEEEILLKKVPIYLFLWNGLPCAPRVPGRPVLLPILRFHG